MPNRGNLDHRVRLEQLRLYAGHAPSSFASSVVLSILLTFFFWNALPVPVLVGWLLLQVVIGVVRLRMVKKFAGLSSSSSPSSVSPPIDTAVWLNIMKWGSFLGGLGWAVGILLLYQAPSSDHRVILAIIVPALCGGAIGSLSLLPALYPIYLVLLMPPFVLLYLAEFNMLGYAIAAMGTLYFISLMSSSLRITRMVENTLRLGIQNDLLKARAEASSQAKSAFLSSVSHELRTPMTSVVGFSKLIRKKLEDTIFPQIAQTDEKTRRAMTQVSGNLDIIVKESERLTLLINDVLDSAKLEAGKMEWNFAPVEPSRLLAQAVAVTATLAEQKGLTLDWQTAEELPAVRADAARIQQVLINLISNAIKFTPKGDVQVEAMRCDERFVVFSIRDSGIGIAPENLDQVFERFRQIGDTLTDKPQGTGLGLSISRQIVEGHGGRIWAESMPGLGSTFRFTLPAEGDFETR